MEVIANGNPVSLDDGARLTDLLATLGLAEKWVVAERNGEAVNRADMATTLLAPGDRIELVRAVAGG
jgi:sulfur carrier protein